MVPPAPGSPEAREIFGGSGRESEKSEKAAGAGASDVMSTSGVVSTSAPVGLAIDIGGDDEDEDDEEMPEIDIRSSDEEDGEE